MLVEGVAEGARMLDSIVDKTDDGEPTTEPESEVENSELDSLLGLQAHLGGEIVSTRYSPCLIMPIPNPTFHTLLTTRQNLHQKGYER